jgi:hypothetical protein
VASIPKVKEIKTAIVIVAVKPGKDPKIIPIKTPNQENKNIIGFVKNLSPSKYISIENNSI